jgi:hypothetical protein
MAIYRLFQNSAFTPEDIVRLSSAYEAALKALNLTRTDAATEQVASSIIQVAQSGVHDPEKICAAVVESFRAV